MFQKVALQPVATKWVVGSSDAESTYIEFAFSPNVRLASVVRRFVLSFCEESLFGDNGARAAIAIQELTENAIKYASDGQTRVGLGFETRHGVTTFEIQTWNRSTQANQVKLRRQIDAMSVSSDRAKFFGELLRDVTEDLSESGLGLGRVFAECDMKLECVAADDIVHVRGIMQFPESKRS